MGLADNVDDGRNTMTNLIKLDLFVLPKSLFALEKLTEPLKPACSILFCICLLFFVLTAVYQTF